MKVVFLDFDGVLNYAGCADRIGALLGLDPDRVAKVSALCCRTGARVVVSSTWRHGRTMTELRDILTSRGFMEPALVIDMTPALCRAHGPILVAVERGHEIQAWLDAHPDVTHAVILDDDRDMAHLWPLLVQTSFSTGLTDDHVDMAERVLREMPLQRAEQGKE